MPAADRSPMDSNAATRALQEILRSTRDRSLIITLQFGEEPNAHGVMLDRFQFQAPLVDRQVRVFVHRVGDHLAAVGVYRAPDGSPLEHMHVLHGIEAALALHARGDFAGLHVKDIPTNGKPKA